MSKHIVVSVRRDRYYWPKLTIVVEGRCSSASAGQKLITFLIMKSYTKRHRGHFGPHSSMRVLDYRVVDQLGLKRLQAAAKASVTVRRKRAAKKAAATRARNRIARVPRSQADVSRPSYELN